MGSRQCEVCCEALSKYKCPSCFLLYCSLGCFKKHKETPCIKPLSSEKEAVKEPSSEPEGKASAIDQKQLPVARAFNVNDPGEIVTEAQLELIASCSEIRDVLRDDEDLRKLICKINSSAEPEMELNKAMEGYAFRIFTGKVLSTFDP